MARQVKLTRAERYKRNYRIIMNTYHNSPLAKFYQTHGAESIFNDLGVRVDHKKTPNLKHIKTRSQRLYYNRKLTKFLYGRGQGLNVVDAKRLIPYRDTKISQSAKYHKEMDKSERRKKSLKSLHARMDLWSEWSTHPSDNDRGFFPPEIELAARDRNRATRIGGKMVNGKMEGGKQLDDYAHYGYVFEFYKFVENKTEEEIELHVKPDPHDANRVRNKYYQEEARAV